MGIQSIDLAQVECLLAIMIDRGYIRGYLSHERSVAVLSNVQPFPPVQVEETSNSMNS